MHPAPHLGQLPVRSEKRIGSTEGGPLGSCVQHGFPFLSEWPSRLNTCLTYNKLSLTFHMQREGADSTEATTDSFWVVFCCREEPAVPEFYSWGHYSSASLRLRRQDLPHLLMPRIGRNDFCNLFSSSGYCVNEHCFPFLQDLLLHADHQILTFAMLGHCISVILLLVT